MTKIKHWLAVLFWCRLMQSHDWTCACEQGIKATDEQLRGGVAGFLDYARMYCARCGTESGLSAKARMRNPLWPRK